MNHLKYFHLFLTLFSNEKLRETQAELKSAKTEAAKVEGLLAKIKELEEKLNPPKVEEVAEVVEESVEENTDNKEEKEETPEESSNMETEETAAE